MQAAQRHVVGGASLGAPTALCCGVTTTAQLCNFCRKTVALVRARRCVSCKAKIAPSITDRVEGKCGDCLSRNQRSSPGTRYVLRLAAKARYALKAAA